MSKIIVIGSISMDLVMETNQIPNQGETVFGEQFSMVPGGKGANQAVAIGRLSNERDKVYMIGAVGKDAFAEQLLMNLKENQIDMSFVGTVPQSTGVAQITLYEKDNRIIYCPGANAKVSTNDWQEEWDLLKNADLVVLQNEISHETNLAIAQFCHEHQVKVIYNPAPARKTDFELLEYVDFITPNEYESQQLFANQNQEAMLKAYPNKLIVTLGEKGSVFYDGNNIKQVPAIKSEVVDTTGAGDTFNGALAYALANQLSTESALKFATLASHLSVQKFGAQGGMPTLEEMKENKAYEKEWTFK
ncbi:ribokinase [Streptococcus urinalis FB127-CNA-2]|uniref:Ribokinase n=1 Tax=Streptococcus urinalis 2285-97 TaxID=764291 RepID=G5KD40_9STRE|nr:ribokinase [Streptococcus urinalis]EHJ57034.1 ribokinase [Streptococcus urinalis 2285-97]EKS19303.1 ribokinase [Streptococcus urinalis FB127-CNA-2]VEF31434.1 ribokinase [Streptococcus urinalis]